MKDRTKNSTKSSRKQVHDTRLRQMVILDALRTWVPPAVAGVAAFVLYVLYNLELVSPTLTVTVIGSLGLLLLLFYGLRVFFDDRPEGGRLALVAGFVVFWFATTLYPFYRAVNPGTPLFSAELSRDGAPVTLPLHDKPGHYSLFVEGHFLPAQSRENRSANYQIAVGHNGQTDRVIEGTFKQEWGSQRVGSGRRSSLVPVMHETNVIVDDVDDSQGNDLTLQLKDISPGVRESISVRLYAPGMPRVLLIGLGLLTLAGALVVDAWRPRDSSQGLMATLTVAALAAVVVFRNSTASTPGFPQLILGGLVGAIGGGIGGSLLWRLAQPLRKYVQ